MTKFSTTDTAAAVLRISSGVLFLAHGLLKVNVFTVAGTVGYFESLGLPGAPNLQWSLALLHDHALVGGA